MARRDVNRSAVGRSCRGALHHQPARSARRADRGHTHRVVGPKSGCATTTTSSRTRFAGIRQHLPRRLLPRAAEAGRRAVRGLSARLPAGPRADRAHGGPDRSRHGRGLRPRVPAGDHAVDRRDLGRPDHAAARPGRAAAGCSPTAWSWARRSRDTARRLRRGSGVGEGLRRGGSSACSRRAAADDGRLAAAFVVELLHWLRDQPPSAAPLLAGAARGARGPGGIGRRDAAARAPARGRRPARDRQRDHEHAAALVDRLDEVLRTRQASSSASCARTRRARTRRWTFQTRDRYRNAVEQVAKRARLSELGGRRSGRSRSRAAVARHGARHDRPHHVGYYLISRGRFRARARHRLPADAARAGGAVRLRSPGARLPGHDRGRTALGVGSLLAYAARHDASTQLQLGWSARVAAAGQRAGHQPAQPGRHVAGAAAAAAEARLLEGIPSNLRTMVVVPAIVDSAARLEALLDDLEVRFLGNRDPTAALRAAGGLRRPTKPGVARGGRGSSRPTAAVDALNERHGAGRFFYFHRERRWNPSEGRWMGWERKRGKLTEFNRLLRGATDTSFIVCHGDRSLLPSVKFVITLDSDTQLPMDAGAAAGRHAGASAEQAAVRSGAAACHRRVRRAAAPRRRGSGQREPHRVRQVFSGHVGVDPYTTAVSDVYQDLFHEGSYVGKGIYDVDAFEAALAGRVPENRCSATTCSRVLRPGGLTTDSHLVDDYPGELPGVRGAAAPLGPRRLADRSAGCGPRCRTRRGRRCATPRRDHRGGRSSTTCGGACWRPSLMVLLLLGWTVLPGMRRCSGPARGDGARVSRLHPGRPLARQPGPRRAVAGPRRGRARQHRHQRAGRRCSGPRFSRTRPG
jgi:hypothetical protein